MPGDLEIRDLGSMPYDRALVLQRAALTAALARRASDGAEAADSQVGTLFLLEHDPPVVTISARRGADDNLLADSDTLAASGVEVRRTDRGGDITYHGPGQLVGYPVLDLNRLGLGLHAYMRLLEEVIIRVCGRFDVEAYRDPDATGVWVGPRDEPRKICAMGIRVKRWISMHGFALNVTTDLTHFGLIVPCGLPDRPVTSLERELGDRCPAMAAVKAAVSEEFGRVAVRRPPG